MTCNKTRRSGFTVLEIVTAMGVVGVFMMVAMSTWVELQTTVINTVAYAQRQNDQMRVVDYLKRDIRRASLIEVYNAGTLVTGTNSGDELRITVPDYYADTREEDNTLGTKTPNSPTVTAGNVNYGAGLTVRYSVIGGAVMRTETGAPRSLASEAGLFALAFNREASGVVRCRVFYNQGMRGSGNRVLRRQVDTLCMPRSALKL